MYICDYCFAEGKNLPQMEGEPFRDQLVPSAMLFVTDEEKPRPRTQKSPCSRHIETAIAEMVANTLGGRGIRMTAYPLENGQEPVKESGRAAFRKPGGTRTRTLTGETVTA